MTRIPNTTKMDNEFSYNYGDLYGNDRFVRMRYNIVCDLLSPYLSIRAKIVDIGCYDGSMFEVLKRSLKNVDYTGIDADKIALEIALHRGAKVMNINFEVDQLPFENNSIDIIIMGEILEHLRDPEKLLKKAQEILKPSGVIVISLPNECTIYHRIKMLLGRGIDGTGFAPGYHLHFPTILQNRQFVQKYFKIIREAYWYHLGLGKFGVFFDPLLGYLFNTLIKIQPSLFARGCIFLCKK